MSKVIKARVLRGRYEGEVVRVTNVSVDDLGRRNAARMLKDNTRFNISVNDLEVIPDEAPAPETRRFAKTASMPFVSGAASSRTMNQTKNMQKTRPEEIQAKMSIIKCEVCGNEFDLTEGECPRCEELSN